MVSLAQRYAEGRKEKDLKTFAYLGVTLRDAVRWRQANRVRGEIVTKFQLQHAVGLTKSLNLHPRKCTAILPSPGFFH